jgi:hypothetical protein
MSSLEAQYLDLEHEVGKHAAGEQVCPACLSRDLKAKEEAVVERCAQIVEGWHPGMGQQLRNAIKSEDAKR